MLITTATVILKTLYQAGITHVFVNWGNDHPSFLEELEKQRVENGGKTELEIVTSPNEMVALSAAQGYAQVTGNPAAVIVHVDVGTQALAAAVHNVDRSRTPVLIFAGASPFSGQGELKGSKNEWPMWLQDIPDQAAIVRQYMRYTAQIQSGKTAAKVIMRALQFATSEPKGPVYLWARREVLAEELDESALPSNLNISRWPAIRPNALDPDVVQTISANILRAEFPLIIVGNTGRNKATVPLLTQLSNDFGVAITTSIASAVCVSYSHPYFIGSSFGGKSPGLEIADVILVIDVEVPWIDATGNVPKPSAQVFVLDPDPLKQGMGWSHVDANILCRADPEVSFRQLLQTLHSLALLDLQNPKQYTARKQILKDMHNQWINSLISLEITTRDSIIPSTTDVFAAVRQAVSELTPSRGRNTFWINEACSNLPAVWDHIRPDEPGSMVCCGGTGIGYCLGGAVGAQLGSRASGSEYELTIVVVGDGTFLFGVPSAAYWMARRYSTPYLTVMLNNGGWASPIHSMKGVYPSGHASSASGDRLTVGFGPDVPDYGGIAAAAGGAWTKKIQDKNSLKSIIEEGIRVVLNDRRAVVLDCFVDSI
ncbi:hypothetical protein QCA50_006616 [Cerrena zonata]|uniref:Uncharacterized protein n=1 Tax=Cerrena zonata TaxID=2478898 RepID=A0AAW0G9F3_9APHY